MNKEKNEIEQLIDDMITNGDELVKRLNKHLPDYMSESMKMFHESNVVNLKKIREFLNK